MNNISLNKSLINWNKKLIKKCFGSSIGRSGYKGIKNSASSLVDLRRQSGSPSPLAAMYLTETEQYIVDVPENLIVKTKLLETWINVIKLYESHGHEAAWSCLLTYFNTCQPETVAEFLGITPGQPWHHDHPLSYVYPWDIHDPETMRHSRITTMRKEAHENGLTTWTEADGWKGFGPASLRIVQLEMHRLIGILDSIRNHGLDERYGYIVGRVFVCRGQEMIQPRRGWHRLAVCLALGLDKIPMIFHQKYTVVRLEDAHCWPNVQRGYFALPEAVDIFNRRFRQHMSPG